MYQFSRGIYRELAPLVERRNGGRGYLEDQLRVLDACESAIRRLASDRQYFAKPARTLFGDVRSFFPVARQHHVYRVIDHYVTLATSFSRRSAGRLRRRRQPSSMSGDDAQGNALPAHSAVANGYCPSHQHLAETEHEEAPALAA